MSDAERFDWPPNGFGGSQDVYVKYADVYDALFDDVADDVRFYLELAASAASGARVLELGTGTGRVAAHFLHAGHAVTGVDSSREMLARAERRLAGHGERFRAMHADVRAMSLGERFPFVLAPYGMVAHLLTDDDRLATFSRVFEHTAPGGLFVFDDMPAWLGAHVSDGTGLDLRRAAFDETTKMPVRLLSNTMDVADAPLSVRYDFIDWLKDGRVARRVVVRIVFRNIALEDELLLLRRAGFEEPKLFGDFAGTPFDTRNLGANKRLVIACRKPT